MRHMLLPRGQQGLMQIELRALSDLPQFFGPSGFLVGLIDPAITNTMGRCRLAGADFVS